MGLAMILVIFVPLFILLAAVKPKDPKRRGRHSGFAHHSDGGYSYDYSGGSSSHPHCGDSGHSSSDGGSCDSGGGDGGGGGGGE